MRLLLAAPRNVAPFFQAKRIYGHLADKDQVKSLGNLSRSAEGHTLVRNTVIHAFYLGYRPDPTKPAEQQLIFLCTVRLGAKEQPLSS